MDRTLFIDDAARLLGVSRRTVYYRITQGRLQTIRTRCGSRRVLLSSIEALLREEHEKRLARACVAKGLAASAAASDGPA
jgi:excisionase family DNA binding protein